MSISLRVVLEKARFVVIRASAPWSSEDKEKFKPVGIEVHSSSMQPKTLVLNGEFAKRAIEMVLRRSDFDYQVVERSNLPFPISTE